MALRFDRSLEPHYGIAERLTPRIQRLLAPNPGPFTFRGTGVYIVEAGDRVVVIDPGPDLPEHIQSLKQALDGRIVSHILVTHTHKDHSPAARPLKAWSGAPVYAFGPHSETNDVEEGGDRLFVPDIQVTDGTLIAGPDFILECVFTPGHTANHMCYALREEKALFTGDHVMGWSTSVVAPPDGNMGDYIRSLERLIARADAILYPTHGSPIPEPGSFLRALLTHRRMREAQIVRCIKRGVDTVPAIVARLYADVAPALHKAAALTVTAHLIHLVEKDRIAEQGEGRFKAL